MEASTSGRQSNLAVIRAAPRSNAVPHLNVRIEFRLLIGAGLPQQIILQKVAYCLGDG
jgi:hypothetical protein